jgi:hypothetical protein
MRVEKGYNERERHYYSSSFEEKNKRWVGLVKLKKKGYFNEE